MLESIHKKSSADAEADVADGFGTKALFQLAQDLGLGDLFELVVQGCLEDPDVKHASAQRDKSGVRGDEVADDFGAELRAILASIYRSRAPQRNSTTT